MASRKKEGTYSFMSVTWMIVSALVENENESLRFLEFVNKQHPHLFYKRKRKSR